jgi:carbonic anhydrase/acetyltransferase-like protein (isoleucine patch superfamily)
MKYELVKTDTKQFCGRTLYRIRALAAIGSLIKPNDLGGYIESEKNLSQMSGDAWVFGNAQIFGNAKVSDNAQVFGNAWVFGDAWVFGNAQVYGNAKVSGDAWVSGNAQVFGNAQVYGNAKVSDNAQVFGNAQVYGNAKVSGDAWVFGNAQVYGNAKVSGDAWVFGNAWVFGDALVSKQSQWLLIGPAKSSGRFTTAFVDEKLGVRVVCGCFTGTVAEFSERIEKTHKENKEHLKQYRLFCQLIGFNFEVQQRE